MASSRRPMPAARVRLASPTAGGDLYVSVFPNAAGFQVKEVTGTKRPNVIEYDDASKEACAAAVTGAGDSGMCVHACARCTLHAMVDQHSLLCAPCEEDEMGDEL